MTTKNEKAEEKTPVPYDAYIVEQRERLKPYWHRIGTGWEHDDAEGFSFPIPKGVTISGELVFRKRKPKDKEEQAVPGSDAEAPV